MSYFKQIASRARLPNQRRSQDLPLLNPTPALFRSIALVEPSELPNERVGLDESSMMTSPQASNISSATQSISSPTTVVLPPASSYVYSGTDLPAVPPPPITIPEAITSKTALSLTSIEESVPDSQSVTPAKQSPPVDRTEKRAPLSISPSPQVTTSSSNVQNLQPNSSQNRMPIIPTKYSGTAQQLSGEMPVETPNLLTHKADIDAASVDNLTNVKALDKPLPTTLEPKALAQNLPKERTTEAQSQLTPAPSFSQKSKPHISEGSTKPISAIAQPLRTTLEPKHSAQNSPREKITEAQSQLLLPSFPRTSKPDISQRSTIHIGTIDIQITPPVVAPKPVVIRPAATSTGSLARGFTSEFGLRQG